MGPVVSHAEDVALGDFERAERAGLRFPADAGLSVKVGLLDPLAVHEELAVPELYRLPRQADDALYQGVFAAVEALEEDDVPAQGFLEVVGELVD